MFQFPHHHSRSRYFIVFGLILLFLAVASQERHAVVRLSVDDGLSQGSAFGLAQDDKGFIWIATADGLNRFDGHDFQVYNTSTGDSGSFAFTRLRNLLHTQDAIWTGSSQTMVVTRIDLITGKIREIFDFDDGSGFGDVCPLHLAGDTLWCLVTNQGLVGVSVSAGKIIQHYTEVINSFPANSVCLYDSLDNRIWYIANGYTQLCSFSLNDKTRDCEAFFIPGTSDTLSVYSVSLAPDRTLRIGAKESVIAYDPSNGYSAVYDLPSESTAEPRAVTAILVAENGDMWCGTNDAFLYKLGDHKGRFELICHPNETTDGVGHRIVRLLMDRTENLWVGTDPAGVIRIDTKRKPFNHTYAEDSSSGLKSNFMKCFAQIEDEIFIGTYDQGINVLNVRSGKYRYINGFGKTQPVIYDMTVDSLNQVWVCTLEGIGVAGMLSTHLERPPVQGSNELLLRMGKTIYTTSNGTMLVGFFTGMFAMVPTGDEYVIDSVDLLANVESFLTDKAGNLWMGAADGIYLSKGEDPHGLKRIIPNTGLVKCFFQSQDGIMWAGTDNGLCKIDVENKSLTKRYAEKDGMPNGFVYGILGDADGNLWLSTNKGITRFDPEHETFRNYSVTDGLQSNEFNTNAFYKTREGELYFGGVNGYNHFYPEAIKDNPYAPECVITGFKVFDKPYALDSTIEYKSHIVLDYTNNNLLLEYAALEFSDPERNSFRYRLIGLDTNWVEASDARFARFVNLDPGDYTFQLKAANNDGVWNNTSTELRITITPPFWQTTWFIVSSIVIGLLLIVLTVRYYFRRQVRTQTREFSLRQSARMNAIIETEERERKRIAEELHDGLGQLLSTARLNISGVESTLPDRDAQLWKNSLALLDEACSEVRSISHNMMPGALIRSGLIEAVNDLANKISDSGKIQVVFNTELEQRFPEAVEIAVYRIVQEILNNMIRHSEADKITIDMRIVNDKLHLVIADNGRSFDVSTIASSEGIGWKNIYSRVEILNGEIDVNSEKGKGTSVFLSVSFH